MSKMSVKILFVQRKESYPEQYAPEALRCITEFVDEENPEVFKKECEDLVNLLKDEIISHKIIEVEVDQNKIRQLLLENPKIKGEINE